LSIKQNFKCILDELLSNQSSDVEELNFNYSNVSPEEINLLLNNRLLELYDRNEIEEIIKLKLKMGLIRKELT
jgi:hypothetical protein